MAIDLVKLGWPTPAGLAYALRQAAQHLGVNEVEDVAVQAVDGGWRLYCGDVREPDPSGYWAYGLLFRGSDCAALARELIGGIITDAASRDDAQEDGQ
jgi:hypothetical protein